MPNTKTNVDPVLNDKAILWMMKDIGIDLGEAAPVIREYVDKVAEVESSGNPKAANKESSARGLFQWLTKGKRNAFQDDLKGAELYYKKAGADVPEWVEKGKKTNDPTELSPEEQKKLFLFRMYRVGKNEDLKEAYSGDVDKQKELYYKKHHTNPDEPTTKRVEQIFGPQGGQAVPAAAQVPLEGAEGQMAPAVFQAGNPQPMAQGAELDVFRNSPYRLDRTMFDL